MPDSKSVTEKLNQENKMKNLLVEWNQAEKSGLVRIRAEDEQENYFDVYGEPDSKEEREEIVRSIEQYGNYYCVSEYFDGEDWQHADSVGMCAGYKNVLSPEENSYVPDLMRAALDLIPQQGEH